MYSSAYSQTSWVSPDSLPVRAYIIHSSSAQVPVGLSFFNYNQIDTNATANNLIQMHSDSLYYDTPGRTTSPYNILNTFVASPLLDSVDANQSSLTFSFPTSLYFNHSTLLISSLKVDFNDGFGLITMTTGTSRVITYTGTAGYKYLKFVITMNNGVIYTTYGKIKVYDLPASGGPENGIIKQRNLSSNCYYPAGPYTITSYANYQGYDESSATPGYGSLQIQYATNGACDGVLRKPILLVDFFDPDYTVTNNSLYDFFDNQQYQIASGSKSGYLDYLRSQGYDVVTLIFQSGYVNGKFRVGGTDYIERNGQVVISAINYLNGVMNNTGNIILMGPSMGGLVTQYALKTMENSHLLHHVKLWVAFDAPFQGANVPLGDQQFVNYFSFIGYVKDQLTTLANNPAAKQMLVNHYLDNASGPGGAPNFRNRFVSEMSTLGFPAGDSGQPFRKLAVIDGSLGGNETNSACQQAFYFTAQFLGTLKFWIFKIRYRIGLANAQVNFTPDAGGNCSILHASVVFKPLKVINYTTPSTTSGYDTAPGGINNFTQEITENGISPASPSGGLKTTFSGIINTHSFVSTKSALAFTGSNQNLSENVSLRNLVCTGETPFSSYYGSLTTNQNHVQLWQGAMDWLLNEFNGIPQQPSYMIQNNNSSYIVSGPINICPNGTFTVTNIPASATVAWSASPASAVTLSPSGQSVVVNEVQSGATISLSAIVTNNCQSNSAAPLSVHVGGPVTPTISGFAKAYPGYYDLIFSTTYVTGINYQWQIDGRNMGGNSSSCTVQAPSCTGATGVIATYTAQVTETNSCGSTIGCEIFNFSCNPVNLVAAGPCGGGTEVASLKSLPTVSDDSGLNYYPNPSNQTLTISAHPQTSTPNTPFIETPYTYTIFDQKGNAVISGSSSGENVVCDVSKLPSNLYILHVKLNDTLYEKKLLIKH